MAKFLRQPHFIVWDNGDLVTHEIMGGLKNVYAIGAVLSLVNIKARYGWSDKSFSSLLEVVYDLLLE